MDLSSVLWTLFGIFCVAKFFGLIPAQGVTHTVSKLINNNPAIDAIENELEKLHDLAENYRDNDDDVPGEIFKEIGRLNQALAQIALSKDFTVSKEITDELRSPTGIAEARTATDLSDTFSTKR